MKLYYLLLAPCLSLWYSIIFYWPTAYHYGTLLLSSCPLPTLLSSTGSMPITMVLYYLHLAHFLCLCYSTIFYWTTAYTSVTLLSSTGSLPIPLVLYYLLLAHCLSIRYSSIFYWIPTYTYGILLSSNGSLPIPTVLFYLLQAHCLSLWYYPTFFCPTAYSTILYWLLPILMILFYLLLIPVHTYGTPLPSTAFLPIPMIFYNLSLAT